MKYKNRLLTKLLYFLYHPDQYEQENISPFKKATNVFQLLTWVYAIVVPLSIGINYLIERLKYSGVNSVEQLIQTESITTVIFLAAFIGPILEESMFRLPLRFYPSYLALTAFLFLKLLISQLDHAAIFSSSIAQWTVPIGGAVLIYFLLISPKVNKAVNNLYKKRYRLFFYLITIAFGYVHLMNYSDVKSLYPAVLVLVIPQILVGAVIGYVRIFYGFQWGFLFHAMYNFLIVIPALLYKQDENIPYQATAGVLIMVFLTMVIYGWITLIANTISVLKNKERK